jgi:hypothetical protein
MDMSMAIEMDTLTPLQEKLADFITHKNVPHLLFYGVSGSGKKTLVNWFINQLYRDRETINEYVMYVNCGHCKGIKFVREELKFFSKTNINVNGHGGHFFKSVVLLNADKLTIDAQSAMRRCIEIFSHTTRFFIVVDDKCKILKPILSRLCEIYLPPISTLIHSLPPSPTNSSISLSTTNSSTTTSTSAGRFEPPQMTVSPKQTHPLSADLQLNRFHQLRTIIQDVDREAPASNLFEVSKKLYEASYTGIELMAFIEKEYEALDIALDKMVEFLFTFNKIKREIKHESMFMFIILYTLFYDSSACMRVIYAAT